MFLEREAQKVSAGWCSTWEKKKKTVRCWLIYSVLLQQSLHAPSTSMSVPAEGVCQPACDVMDMTTVWMAQMRSVQRRLERRKTKRCCCSFKQCSSIVYSSSVVREQFFFFQITDQSRLKHESFSVWVFLWLQLTASLKGTLSMIPDVSLSSDWLCEGVPGGRVPLPESCSLYPSALALWWRVGLHGPQWWGKLQPG